MPQYLITAGSGVEGGMPDHHWYEDSVYIETTASGDLVVWPAPPLGKFHEGQWMSVLLVEDDTEEAG